MLKEGLKAPDFTLQQTDGKKIKLSQFKGKYVVLYFYPRDMTPGCTVEACALRDSHAELKKRGAIILGVSADDIESHKKFTKKYDLPFALLADTEKGVSAKYGTWQQKSFMGKKFMGIVRTTFLIGKDQKILKVFQKVKPLGHDKEIIEFLDSIK